MKNTLCAFTFILFVCFTLSVKVSAQDLYDYGHSLLYAGYLFNSEHYDYASAEYERLVFLDPANDSLKLMLIGSYFKGGNYSAGINRAVQLYPDRGKMPHKTAWLYARSLLLGGAYGDTRNFIAESKTLCPENKLELTVVTDLLEYKWDDAKKHAGEWTGKDALFLEPYKPLIDQAMDLRYKSPSLAAFMSAAIPGMGKVYTNHWKDGLISFVFVSANTWQSYRSFKKKGVNSAYGWIFGSVAFGFYIGNIYGSGKSAKQFNQMRKDEIRKNAERFIFDRPVL